MQKGIQEALTLGSISNSNKRDQCGKVFGQSPILCKIFEKQKYVYGEETGRCDEKCTLYIALT